MWNALLYAVAFSAAASMVALGLERLTSRSALSRRGVWAAAMLVSVAGPLVVMSLPGAASPPEQEAPTAATGAPADRMDAAPAAEAGTPLPAIARAAERTANPSSWKIAAPSDRQVLIGWVASSFGLAVYFCFSLVSLQRRSRRWSEANVQETRVLVSTSTGPALFGLLRPQVVVPRWFFDQEPLTQSIIMAHELQHRNARDPQLLWAAMLAVVMVPWNLPLWWQLRRLRMAVECDCDARVVRSGVDPLSYGAVLLAVMRRASQQPAGTVAMSAHRSLLERRIGVLASIPEKHAVLRTFAVLTLGIAAVAGAATLDAPELPGAENPGTREEIPLLLPPTQRNDEMARLGNLGLMRLAERYPELTQTPSSEDIYAGVVSLSADGQVLGSKLAPLGDKDMSDLLIDLRENLPTEGATLYTSGRQGSKLPDGTVLTRNISLATIQVSADYDPSRSWTVIERAVRERHPDLLLPGSSGEINILTVFLSEDGKIQREDVERIPADRPRGTSPRDPAYVAKFAATISRKLALPVESIGSMGDQVLEGSLHRSAAAVKAGSRREAVDRKLLEVHYAWPRRVGEAAPSMPQYNRAKLARPDIDVAVASRLVERYLPDAYISKDKSLGMPILVLSADGRVTSAGRLKTEIGKAVVESIREQLVPTYALGMSASERVTSSHGDTATVSFYWDRAASNAPPLPAK